MKNIKIIAVLFIMASVLNLNNVDASDHYPISAILYGTIPKSAPAVICNEYYPAIYTQSADTDTLVAMKGMDGQMSEYYLVKQGSTFTFTYPDSIIGGGVTIEVYLKNSSSYWGNNYSGILFL